VRFSLKRPHDLRERGHSCPHEHEVRKQREGYVNANAERRVRADRSVRAPDELTTGALV
jgi:hypothetical protein